MTPAAATSLANQLKALAEPTRLQLIEAIAAKPGITNTEMQAVIGHLTEPTISHHLKKLRLAGLVTCERKSTWVHYTATPGVVEDLAAAIGRLR